LTSITVIVDNIRGVRRLKCKKCSGEMIPVNVGESIYECLNCRTRQHRHCPDLDVNSIRADLIGVVPLELISVFPRNDGLN
jgi:hypothetical protein